MPDRTHADMLHIYATFSEMSKQSKIYLCEGLGSLELQASFSIAITINTQDSQVLSTTYIKSMEGRPETVYTMCLHQA